MNEHKKTQLYKNLITASVASVIARTIICPLERVEILRQIESKEFKGMSITRTLIELIKKQGLTCGLFKGNSASVIRIFPFSAIEFYSMEFFKNLLIRDSKIEVKGSDFFYKTMICGSLTGLCAITLTYPFDLIRTRMAANITDSTLKQTRFFSTLINIFKTNGMIGLYRGYVITFFGSMPFVAIKQTSYEMLKVFYMNKNYQTILNFIYGSLSGVVGTTLLYPSYLFKRVSQASSK